MLQNWDKYIFRFFIIWYVCGVILLTFDLLPPWLEWANVVFLMTAGILGFIFFIKNYKYIGLLFSLFVFFFSIIAEHIGVKYGFLFGNYYYNADFGPQLFGVPITIGFAWVMVIATSLVIATRIVKTKSVWLISLIGSFAAVVMDLIIDPVSYVAKSYWIWVDNGFYYNIPTFNFVSWYGLSFFFFMLFLLFAKGHSPTDLYWEKNMFTLYGLMILMFIIIAISAKLWLAVVVTTIPATILLILAYARRSLQHDTR
ncbi:MULTISPECIES: carotenoid biosynthesis protein [Bacillus]|uniref:carotenoid biosynthesis protein n=1 Tax=Bacillus TaxID=1386 RepID=UPI001D0D440E|nr:MULTISPECIES: carotenoid biosynthesis protein [Bacillus]